MKTFLILEHKHEREIPKEFHLDDNRNPENLVRYFLNEFTKPGDLVLDPFAGLGTTLIVAEEVGRIPYGIEYVKERASYIKSQIKNKENLINGSSLELKSFDLPEFDFCFTSPPYTRKTHEVDAFSSYTKEGNYDQYLSDIHKIYLQIKDLMKKDSYIVIEVSNLKGDGEVTTLAWDIAKEVSKVFHFEGEIVIGWTGDGGYDGCGTYGFEYDHSYCLVFKNK
ncbi:MAG: DNA methyltransferase [Thermoplasmata archaeon]|nr:DNA methyltransferase [Thermoplasmata archaeon]